MLMVTAQDAGEFRYEVLLLICAVMGLFDGCFVTLIGPIAFDLCGPAGASQAIGSLLGLFSVPMTTGPPVAGIIYDKVTLSVLYFILVYKLRAKFPLNYVSPSIQKQVQNMIYTFFIPDIIRISVYFVKLDFLLG